MDVAYKGYVIASDGTFGYNSIKYDGKGSVPNELVGIYTKKSIAMQAIDKYLDSKKQGTKEVNKGGKTG